MLFQLLRNLALEESPNLLYKAKRLSVIISNFLLQAVMMMDCERYFPFP